MTRKVERSRRTWRARLFRWVLYIVVLAIFVPVLQVGALRFVDPWFSSFMAIRQFGAVAEGDLSFRIQYDWRDLDRMSPHLPVALVASEDQRFTEHFGFDVEAIEKAHRSNSRGRKMRGGSTISQQVAKNLFLWSGRSWVRKGIEAWYTLLIEVMWPKQRILEVYANVAEFGDGVYGGQAAARSFFRKDARKLTVAESARLAAVLPSPRRYDAQRPGPYVRRRAQAIERQMGLIGGSDYLRRLD